MFSSRIQYYNGKIYTDLYTYEGADSKFLLSEVNMKDGKRTSFWLDAVQYNKGWMNCSLQTNNLFISQYEGKPRFSQLFMDTIFAITKDDIQPYIVLQSENFVTKDYLDSQKETKKASKIFSNLNNTTKI